MILGCIHVVRRGLVAEDRETWNIRLYPAGGVIGEVRIEGAGTARGVNVTGRQPDIAAVRELLQRLSPSQQPDMECLLAIEDRVGESRAVYRLNDAASYAPHSPEARLWELLSTLVGSMQPDGDVSE